MNNHSSTKTVSFCTLGCKLNQAETNAMQNQFVEKGFEIHPFGKESDLTVVNTCTVTNQADSKSRSAIRDAVKASPTGRVAVTGCYAQIKPTEIEKIQGVDLILGNSEKHHIFNYLERTKSNAKHLVDRSYPLKPLVFVNDCGDMIEYNESTFISSTFRTRAFLKIQEGCDYYCSYCIIPYARGKARSRSFNSTIDEAKRLVDTGIREVVLTGINIGTYRYENGTVYHLCDLLESLSDIDGLERIRISSIEPNTLNKDLLYLIKDRENICPHLHIPLQSGSNDILKQMKRKYSIDEYIEVIELIKTILPDIAIGTDIIVGFPGETDVQFQETVRFVSTIPFTYLHVFRYSPREGTLAANMSDQVDERVKKDRSVVLRKIGSKKKYEYAQKYLGKVLPVLFESRNRDGEYVGFTSNYIRVRVKIEDSSLNSEILSNSIRKVLLKETSESGICGQIYYV